MNEKKMISIDQFDADERLAVEQAYKVLAEKYRQRTGKEPDSKKEREFNSEARQQVMARKLERARVQAEKQKKPLRKKKPSSLTASEVSDFNWSASVAKGRR
ncbi:hypothetical protein ACLHDD_20095 [Pantoea sp. NSTU24]|uniref:hypothetical protein n=1 Tax=Pantoea sp. NSTU24 TaxID=3391144 RepID=UPI003D07A60E